MSSDKNERLRPVDWAILFAGTFEAELLLELMLQHFGHPLATDREYRNSLLEAVAGVLHASADGEILIEDFPPDDMNFVAAIWFVETTAVHDEHSNARYTWARKLKDTIPSCFVSQEELF